MTSADRELPGDAFGALEARLNLTPLNASSAFRADARGAPAAEPRPVGTRPDEAPPGASRAQSLLERLDRWAARLGTAELPRGGRLSDDLTIAGHLASRTWRMRAEAHPLRRALVDLALVTALTRGGGRGAVHAEGGAFHPLPFLPDFHGPHFHEAVRRLLVPGTGPFVVHLSLTAACPWRCRYCFAEAGGPAVDVSDEALERTAGELAARRVPIVILGGGEPLTRFPRALRLVERLARGCEVRMTTSGAGLTQERAQALRAAGLHAIALSLDSGDAAQVDATRGAGAFDTAERALTAAEGAGLFTLVTSVVSRSSFTDEGAVDRYLRRVASLHPRAVVNFLPEFATGRGASDGFRAPHEFAPVARRLARAVRAGGHHAGVLYGGPMDALVGCVGAAQRQLVIDPRGDLRVCVSGASFGNVHAEPFDDVWQRMLVAPARYKRGYFCAQASLKTAPEKTVQALRAFHLSTPDALLQRVLDLVGPALGSDQLRATTR